MGSCVTMDSRQSKQYRKDMRKPPQDIQVYLPHSKQNLQSLQFQGTLTDVGIEGDPMEPIGICFQISGNKMKSEYPLTFIQENDKRNQKWKIKQKKFKFKANQYQIRSQSLSIKIFNKHNQTLQHLKINLYKVLTGPIKNNFKILLKNNLHFNLLYDLQIFQILKMEIKVKSAQLQLKNQHRGQKFNFTIECNLNEHGKNNLKIMTRPSPSKSTVITEQSIMEQIKDDHEQPVIIGDTRMRNSLKQIEKQRIFLDWDDSQNLPEISFNLTVNQINSSLFLFHCWKVSLKKQNHQKQVLHRFSNFKMTLYEILQLRSFNSKRKPKKSIVTLNQKIWENGKEAGNCKCQLQITVPQYLKQLTGLTRTQKGIFDNTIENFQIQKQFKNLQLQDQMKFFHQKLLSMKMQMIEKAPNNYRKKQIIRQTTQLVTQIHQKVQILKFNQKILLKNTKEVNIFFEKQYKILQLLNTILNLLSWQDKKLNNKCWALINVLIKRPQLQLKYFAFTEKQITLLQNQINMIDQTQNKTQAFREKSMNLLQKKIKIGIEFIRLKFDCLIQSLKQGISMIDQNFDFFPQSELFKSQCLIRIPIFRDYILREISSPEDSNYSDFLIKEREWLKPKFQNKQRQTQLIRQIQWNQFFYTPLRISKDVKQKQQELFDVIKESIWVEEIAQRDLLFFRLLRIVMQNYKELHLKFNNLKYQYFPGYKKFITLFLNELKNRSFFTFSQSLIISSMFLLQNQDLHEPILLLLAKKTNYYDTPSVLKCLSVYRLYINKLTKGNKTLPVSFCFGVFINVIKKILLSQSQTCVTAILLVVYEAYENLEPEFQCYLTLYFLGSKFFSLFYHWSYVVRSIFHNFFILKIAQNKFIFLPNFESQIRLKTSYQKVLIKLQQNQKKKLQADSIKISKNKNVQQYFQRMRYKMLKRRKQKQAQNIEDKKQNKFIFFEDFSQRIKNNNKNEYKKQSQSLGLKWPSILDLNKKQKLLRQSLKNQFSNRQIEIRSQKKLQEDVQMPQIPQLKLQKKQYTYHESAKYHDAFTQSQFVLSQMTQLEKNQISISHQQFQKINQQITSKLIQTNQLPSLLTQTYAFFEYGNLMVQNQQFTQQN